MTRIRFGYGFRKVFADPRKAHKLLQDIADGKMNSYRGESSWGALSDPKMIQDASGYLRIRFPRMRESCWEYLEIPTRH